jgi:hypothetical protein
MYFLTLHIYYNKNFYKNQLCFLYP